ncbi:MAG: hypothetical protein NC177_01525 [Ruminococcus flavefaciens]|nr:hypothetical protein [Ruminococcus flavefaciens]
MKKMVSFISALAMCAVMAAPMASFADEVDDPNAGVGTSQGGQTDPTDPPKEDDPEEDGDDIITGTEKTYSENEEGDITHTSYATLKVACPSVYTVIIPDGEIDITAKKQANLKVSADKVLIGEGETLKVSVSSNDWKLHDIKPNSKATIEYKLTKGETEVKNLTGGTVLEVEAGTASGEATMIAKVDESTIVKSGTYKDTLTFTVGVYDSEDAVVKKYKAVVDDEDGGDNGADTGNQTV